MNQLTPVPKRYPTMRPTELVKTRAKQAERLQETSTQQLLDAHSGLDTETNSLSSNDLCQISSISHAPAAVVVADRKDTMCIEVFLTCTYHRAIST